MMPSPRYYGRLATLSDQYDRARRAEQARDAMAATVSVAPAPTEPATDVKLVVTAEQYDRLVDLLKRPEKVIDLLRRLDAADAAKAREDGQPSAVSMAPAARKPGTRPNRVTYCEGDWLDD